MSSMKNSISAPLGMPSMSAHVADTERWKVLIDLVFVSTLLLGPLAIWLSRLAVRIIPVELVVEFLTSYNADRIRAEQLRINVEGADYFYFLIVLSLVASLCVYFILRPSMNVPLTCVARYTKSRFSFVNSCAVTLILLLAHFGSLHRWRTDTFGERFLDGFGAGPAIAAVGLAVLTDRAKITFGVLRPRPFKRVFRWAFSLVAIIILLPQTLIFGRQIGSNREYVIVFNEYASTSSNLRPFWDFVPTYTSLAAVVVEPLLKLVSEERILDVLVGFHIALSVILLVGATWLATRILQCHWSLALLATAVLISPRRHNDLAQGFLPSTSAPGRYILPVIALLALSFFFKNSRPRISQVLVVGITLGLALVNNADMGLPLTVAAVVAMGIKTFFDRGVFHNLVGPVLVAILTFTVVLHFLGGGHVIESFKLWSLFIRSRSAGGYIEAVPMFGVHQFALALHAAAIVFGILLMRSTKRSAGDFTRFSALMCLTLGLFGFTTFPYFLGQNGPTFVGGVLWLPLILTAFAIVGALYNFSRNQRDVADGATIEPGQNSFKLVSLGLAVLTFCSVMFVPDPQDSVGIHFRHNRPVWSSQVFLEDPVIQELRQIALVGPVDSDVAYYGEYGNLISLILKLKTVYGVHDPMIAYSSRESVNATCAPLTVHNPRVVYASKRFLPEKFLDSSITVGPCPGLSRDPDFMSKNLIRYTYKP